MKKIIFTLLIVFLATVLLTGCQFTRGTEEKVKQSGMDYIDNVSYSIISEEDFEDTETQDIQESNEPTYEPPYDTLNYVRKGTNKVIDDINVDEQNGYGTVDVNVTIKGRLEYLDNNDNVVEEKNADINGTASLVLEKKGGKWEVTGREFDFSTVDSAITINQPNLDDPVLAGDYITVNCNISNTGDKSFRLLTDSKVSWPDCILNYSQEDNNTAKMKIFNGTPPNTYAGFIKTVVWGSIVDPAEPLEINVKSFEFEVVSE